jgi:hypothetical protein
MGWDLAASLVAAVAVGSRLVRLPSLHVGSVLVVYVAVGLLGYEYTLFLPGLVLLLVSGVASAFTLLATTGTPEPPLTPADLLQSAGALVVTVLMAYLVTRSIELSQSPRLDGTLVWLSVSGLMNLVIQVPRSVKVTGLLWLVLATYTGFWVLMPHAGLVSLAALAIFCVSTAFLASVGVNTQAVGSG